MLAFVGTLHGRSWWYSTELPPLQRECVAHRLDGTVVPAGVVGSSDRQDPHRVEDLWQGELESNPTTQVNTGHAVLMLSGDTGDSFLVV